MNPYLGVVVESPRVCLVSPYCAKGSLRVCMEEFSSIQALVLFDELNLKPSIRYSCSRDVLANILVFIPIHANTVLFE